MTVIEMLTKELKEEAATTRKMLARIPSDQFDFRPHEKSMNIQKLANHVAELPYWVDMSLHFDGLDFASSPYQPTTFRNVDDLLNYFEKGVVEAEESLARGSDDMLLQKWTLRTGDQIHQETTKGESVRMSFCQTVHHRAQLGVYLRLLNVPIPGSYGPSADEVNF